MVEQIQHTKKFYCGTRNACPHKEHYINNRCFAPYVVRQSCRYIVRKDGKSIAEGSREEIVQER